MYVPAENHYILLQVVMLLGKLELYMRDRRGIIATVQAGGDLITKLFEP